MADEHLSDRDSTYHPRIHSSLRILTTVSFIPAFPLCIAHGVLSHLPVPAVGLVPLAVSATGSVVLIRSTIDDAEGIDGKTPRPVIVFFYDIFMAAALVVVLVFTWIIKEGSPGLSMLAAYATIPLLFNFIIHLFLAIESIYTGLAIHSLVQWIAWRTLPPDCPHCNHRLRPDFPILPWINRMRHVALPYSDLFVDDAERYHDEEQHLISPDHMIHTPQPAAVEVRRKDRRLNAIPRSTSSAESSDMPTIGMGSGAL